MVTNNLSPKEAKSFEKKAKDLTKVLARVGSKIQNHGTESQQAAWASI